MKNSSFLLIFFIFLFSKPTAAQWVLDYHSHRYLNYVSVVDSNIVWAVGIDTNTNADNIILRRSSSSAWVFVPTNGIYDSHDLVCIAAKDSLNAWVADGPGGSANGGAHLYRTTNGGLNWTVQVSTGGNFGYFNGIQFSRLNPQYGYAWSDPPDSNGTPLKVYRTSDGGISWNVFSVTVDPRFRGTHNSICVTDSSHAWFGLYNSSGFFDNPKILYTTNGGINFLTSNLPFMGYSVQSIEFKYNSIFGISATDDQYDYFCRSLNGGVSWQYVNYTNIGTSVRIYTAPGSNTWYAATYLGQPNTRLYKSTNDALSWFPMQFPDSLFDFLRYMDGITAGERVHLYAISDKGKIFRLTDNIEIIGIKPISNEVPHSFSLHQNYPNPFNPTTKIRFSLPSPSKGGDRNVKLLVFDVIGREIETLVNEQLQPGTYEVTWDGSKYASGVYFYRIVAGDFADMKKMILLK